MKIKVFGCPSVRRELYLFAALSANEVEIEIVPHQADSSLLQRKIDETKAERIVLAMGACRTVGLHSGSTRLIAPKAHNCSALLLGSAERYRQIFSENDDSPVWINGQGCLHAGAHGQRCAVYTGLIPKDYFVPNGTKEYVSDLSLLRAMIEQTFDENSVLTVFPGERIVFDPEEIIVSEPF